MIKKIDKEMASVLFGYDDSPALTDDNCCVDPGCFNGWTGPGKLGKQIWLRNVKYDNNPDMCCACKEAGIIIRKMNTVV